MADLTTIIDGIEALLGGISGLKVVDHMPGTINPPVAVIGAPEVDYDAAMNRGQDRVVVPIFVLVSRSDNRGSQKDLHGYASGSGSTSVKAVINADRTLNGALEGKSARVTNFRPLGLEEVAAVGYFGGRFDVEIHTRGV